MITISSDSANLGDNLMLTPLLNATPCRLRLLDEEWMRYTAEIFRDLCEIEWVKDKANLGSPSYADILRPWSKRALVAHGFNDVPAIPKIKLSDAEIEDGRRWADHTSRSFGGKPLCIIKRTPGRSIERAVPTEVIDRIVSNNPDIQFVTFNLGGNHPKKEMTSPPIKGVFEMLNMPVRAQASCYAAVGRYVGCDTGDYHLMLAVGGKADVLCPSHRPTYNYWLTHYGEDCWLDEAVRVSYQDFAQPLSDGVTGVRL